MIPILLSIIVSTGTKEMEALQLMISTYTETPNFGDAKKFQEELESVSTKVGNLSQDLISLNRELDLVESKMNLNMRHSLLATTSRSLLSLDNSSLSGGSDSTGYGSQESNDAVNKGGDSHDTNDEVSESEEMKDSVDRISSVSKQALDKKEVQMNRYSFSET